MVLFYHTNFTKIFFPQPIFAKRWYLYTVQVPVRDRSRLGYHLVFAKKTAIRFLLQYGLNIGFYRLFPEKTTIATSWTEMHQVK